MRARPSPSKSNATGNKTRPLARIAAANSASGSSPASFSSAPCSVASYPGGSPSAASRAASRNGGRDRLVGLGEQQVEDDQSGLGLVERRQGLGEIGAAQRPAAERGDGFLIDEDDRDLIARLFGPAQAKAQVERGGFEAAQGRRPVEVQQEQRAKGDDQGQPRLRAPRATTTIPVPSRLAGAGARGRAAYRPYEGWRVVPPVEPPVWPPLSPPPLRPPNPKPKPPIPGIPGPPKPGPP